MNAVSKGDDEELFQCICYVSVTSFVMDYTVSESFSGKTISKIASLGTDKQSIAGKQNFCHYALPNTRSRVECSTIEKSPLWALLTDAFHQGLHTWSYDVRGLTLGSSSKQFHFPTSSTSPLCSMEYLRSNDAISL